MEVEVRFNGDDITTSVVSYNMQKKICTGVGSLEIEVVTGGSYDPWDIIEIWEYGIKKGKFFVSKILDTLETGVTTLSCLDNVKRLQDYFIAESYLVDYPSTCKYWIEKFMVEAGVEYEFTVEDSGSLLSNNTSLGVASAYEQIVILIQMSGWYMYFDNNGIAIIGKLNTDISNPTNTFYDTDIISIKNTLSDEILRNRAVVWGTADPTGKEWVYADVSIKTLWDYDDANSRAVVLSNSNIPTVGAAYSLAYKMLNEWSHLLFTKELTIHGGRNVSLGDAIYIDSKFYCGIGIVTTVGSEMSSQGLITNIILDEKCARLFGMFNLGGYVYIGTWGGGIKRKSIKGTTWSDYSSGLTDLYIKDLFCNDGVLTCVTKTGKAFVSKEINGYWSPISIPSGTKARSVTQNKLSNNVRLLVDTASGDNYIDDFDRTTFSGGEAWILDITPNRIPVGSYPVTLSDITLSGITGFDIDNDGYSDYISIGITTL